MEAEGILKVCVIFDKFLSTGLSKDNKKSTSSSKPSRPSSDKAFIFSKDSSSVPVFSFISFSAGTVFNELDIFGVFKMQL